ncbi:hypothetical protein B0H17DRAFT_450884 [Mycena rosella]|uniref:F-box domain-containing protein n=1 Tax=Mycena rosella TaxID=1033263 RepID=A0AAD7MAL1_MYCRO|nr:hypothetical protein B0H17DRAFT_450884 [Mycena rosella]
MHRALRFLDLVHLLCIEIAGDLPQYGYGPGASRDLAALARTCKTFQEAALDLLWAHQNNMMVNILMCMPDDLWRVGSDGRRTLDITRPIGTSDWERPFIYMRRVKKFIYRDNTMPASTIFEMLDLAFPGDHLFPNLRFLGWNSDCAAASLPMIRIFLSPKITEIVLAIQSSIHHLSFLPTLAVKCRDMKIASIRCPITEVLRPTVIRSLSLFICGLGSLQTLFVYDLDQTAFIHLAHLRTLTSLEIGHPEGFNPSCGVPDEGIFLSLRNLRFRFVTPESLGHFLRPFGNSPLISLNISVTTDASTNPGLYSSIVENLSTSSRATLGQLTVSSNQPHVIGETMITPLFCLPYLTVLSLSSQNGFDLDDATLSDMAAAWPCIETLELRFTSFSLARTITPRATLRALQAFAHHCPKLRKLQVRFDASVVPEWDGTTVLGSLIGISINQSSISAPVPAVASFLSHVFPHLAYVQTCYWEWEGLGDVDEHELDDVVIHNRRWKAVERLLPAYVPKEDEDEDENDEDEASSEEGGAD